MDANLRESDTALLKRIRHGDSNAFLQLSRRHESKIFAVSWRILKNREDAEDNAQSTFIRAYFHCDQFRGESQFSTWLMRVAINGALMRFRRRKAHKEVSLNSDARTDDDFVQAPDPSYEATQERECIAKDLASKLCSCLSPSLRDPFVLSYIEGWSHKELSRFYGVPQQTIKSRIFRARRQLRKKWAKYASSNK